MFIAITEIRYKCITNNYNILQIPVIVNNNFGKEIMKLKRCDYGKAIKKRLIELDKNQVWLIQQVRDETGMYFDDSYLWRIMYGKVKTPSMVEAINTILGIEYC